MVRFLRLKATMGAPKAMLRMVMLWALNLACAARAAKPHRVMALIDDLGWHDVGWHNDELKLPNLDALKADGVELDRTAPAPGHKILMYCLVKRH